MRPETMFLETVNVNLVRYLLPPLSVKRLLFGLLVNGIGSTSSGRSRNIIVRLRILTSASLLSACSLISNNQWRPLTSIYC